MVSEHHMMLSTVNKAFFNEKWVYSNELVLLINNTPLCTDSFPCPGSGGGDDLDGELGEVMGCN